MSTPRKKSPDLSAALMPAVAEAGVVPLDLSVRAKLSIMMFLQYFAWGAWYVSMGTYLGKKPVDSPLADMVGFSELQLGSVWAVSAIAALIAPFFVGMV